MKPTFFVGSLPFLSVEKAIKFVKENSFYLPFLPQLPELNPQEDMIGQVLRGFELGYWDEKASMALGLFQNEFCESPQVKIQIAGPLTISRALSLPFESISSQWQNLVRAIVKQLRQGAFLGELWIQIDEPFLSEECPLPKGKPYLFEIPKGVWGLHSCATRRPQLDEQILENLRFLSFDCEKTPLTDPEKELYGHWLDKDSRRVFAWGQSDKSFKTLDPWVLSRSQIWLSAPCGLYGQSL